MNKNLKIFLSFIIPLTIVFVAFLSFQAMKGSQENYQMEFSGVVESVSYDKKGFPTISVNKAEYYLSNYYNFNYEIEKGDIIKKKQDERTCILIKKNTGKVFQF